MAKRGKQSQLLVLTFVSLALLAVTMATEELTDGLFTSNADLQDLLETEATLVTQMKDYIAEEERRLEKLKG